jgi:hypothetical protein
MVLFSGELEICLPLSLIELSRPVICHLVGVRENGKQLDESIFCKIGIGVFNRLKNQLIFAVTGERVKVSI